MVVPLAKRRKELNGRRLGDSVAVILSDDKRERREIRILGEAGFYVKGLATCFYWTEKGRAWDDVEKESEPCP